MSALKDAYDISRLDADTYWELVHRTVNEVFGLSPSAADPLEAEIRGVGASQQLLFYHSEPLSVASDIAECAPTSQQMDQYKILRSQIYQLP